MVASLRILRINIHDKMQRCVAIRILFVQISVLVDKALDY